jgi:hypothetical protein
MKKTLEKLQNSIIGNNTQATDLLKTNSKISKQKQLQIYQEGYKIRLLQAVKSDYPTFCFYMGEEESDKIILDFVENNNSEFYSLDFYPFKFSDYIQNKNISTEANQLATLESYIAQIFYAKDSAPLTAQHITQMSEVELDSFRFKPRTASAILQFDYDVENYLQKFRAGENPSQIENRKNYIYIVRNNNEVKRFYLDEEEFVTLNNLLSGQSTEAAVNSELAQELFPQWLNKWLINGFFALI